MRKSRAACNSSSRGSVMRRARSISSAAAPIAGAKSRARATGSARVGSFIRGPTGCSIETIAVPGSFAVNRAEASLERWRFPMTHFDLTGCVAVVTGGNGGIGLGMAKGLAAAGASVVLAARNAEKAEAAVAELGGKSVFIALDVADEASCREMIARVAERSGRLDVLVNNAGTS